MYMGTQAFTKSGKACLVWDNGISDNSSQLFHNYRNGERLADATGKVKDGQHNYCRSPMTGLSLFQQISIF